VCVGVNHLTKRTLKRRGDATLGLGNAFSHDTVETTHKVGEATNASILFVVRQFCASKRLCKLSSIMGRMCVCVCVCGGGGYWCE
jgi:hypothetical protein